MIVLHAYILAITISSTFMLSTFSFSVVDYFKVGYWLFQSAIVGHDSHVHMFPILLVMCNRICT